MEENREKGLQTEKHIFTTKMKVKHKMIGGWIFNHLQAGMVEMKKLNIPHKNQNLYIPE